MRRLGAFVKLDWFTIKPYCTWKNTLLFLVMAAVVSQFGQSISMMVGVVMMYASMYVSYPFAVGEKSNLDALYATLALSRREVVAGRYLFAIGLDVGAAALALAAGPMVRGITGEDVGIVQLAATIAIVFAVFSLVQAVQLPLYFKLGYAKAKFVAVMPYVLISVGGLAAATVMKDRNVVALAANVFVWIEANPVWFAGACMTVWAVIMAASCRLAAAFYQKRAF